LKKILIVDDDVDIIDLVENRLRKNGYDVIYANDGDNGVKKALVHKPDLIIMDVMMPHMHGGEAVKLLQSYEDTKDIPVLFFTAMNSYIPASADLDQINVDGRLYPAITKPFEPNKLLAAIKSLLDG
jgi:two-component system alkaline phosphatase synthesis response regulator PhoP